jgi:hypothetical protein
METIEQINNLIKTANASGNISSKDINDGHHTFRELYKERLVLFCSLCNAYQEISWKSRKHFDEENDPMFPGDFIAGINTPKGIATFHFKLEYWDLFAIKELDRAPKYDNYTPEDVMIRILSLKTSSQKGPFFKL